MLIANKAPVLYEKMLVIVGFIIFSDAFRTLFSYGQWQLIRMSLYAAVLVVCGLTVKRVLPTVFAAPVLLVLTVYAVSSVIWSDVPGATISRSIALVVSTLFVIYFVSRFSLNEQVRLLTYSMIVMVIASYIFVFVLPSYGRDGSYAWLGVFEQKNVLGRVMSVSALLFLVYPAKGFRGRTLKWGGYLLALIMVLQSNSMTALIITLTITILFYAYKATRLGTLPGFALFFTTIVPVSLFAFIAITVDTDDILIALGRDPSLTGRTDVWENLDYAISERPLFGYGYGAFWNMWDQMYGELWSRRDHWKPTSAHHAYRDVTVEVGKVGFGIFVVATVIMVIQALNLVRKTQSNVGLWPILYISLVLVLGFSESFILYNTLFWTLFVATGYALGKVSLLGGDVGEIIEESPEQQTTQPSFVPAYANR